MKPTALCEVNESKNNIVETLTESLNYIKTLHDIVPESEVKSTFKVLASHIRTALQLQLNKIHIGSNRDHIL